MTTKAEVRNRVLRLLGDPQGAQYEVSLLDDALASALIAVCKWVPKTQNTALAGDNSKLEFDLPANLYRITAVLDSSNDFFLPQTNLTPGISPGVGKASNNQITGNDWIEYPEGHITFANAPSGSITVYYGAIWKYPTEDNEALETPSFLLTAITYYCCGYVVSNNALASANTRQYNVKVDSGTPSENPLRDMATYFFKLFENEMNSLPARVRGVMQ
jgi:hypothetical protein